MARITPQMKSTIDLRERCLSVIADLESKLATERQRLSVFDEVLAAMRGETLPDIRLPSTAIIEAANARMKNTKKTVLEVISKTGSEGITAAEVVVKAAENGKELKPGSVSSLLSKLKADGILTFDGERYFPVPPGPSLPLKVPPLKVVGT